MAKQVAVTAEACGFGTEESMRRAFAKVLNVSPRGYRQRFGGTQ